MQYYALITGATSGIGLAFAEAFAAGGYNLILTGRREELLKQKATHLQSKYRINVRSYKVELTNEPEVDQFVAEVLNNFPVEILVNNAGYSYQRGFLDDTFANQSDMITVHNIVPVKLIKAFLPQMVERKKGIIINVSSMGAFVPLKKDAIYSGAKAFLIQLTKSLDEEMKNCGIYLQVLVPGFVYTDFFMRSGTEEKQVKKEIRATWMKPEEVVRYSMHCARKKKILCIPGLVNRLYYFLLKIIPDKLLLSLLEKQVNHRI